MNFKNLIMYIFCLIISGKSFAQKLPVQKRLDSLFTALTAQNQFNGSVLIAEKGKVVYKAGKGYSNETSKELNNSQTVFELASCSKQFLGVAVALLHREGKISYTDDITKHIPELSNFKGVTIYSLLRHTSGIPEYLESFREDWKSNQIANNQDLITYYSSRKDTLEFQPGSRHRYCNTNYAFLATIIERASAKSLNDYLTEKIFKPLNMQRTFVYNRRLSPKKIKNYAYGYVWIKNSFEKAIEDDPRVGEMSSYYMDGIVGSAKINSSVEDMYKWYNALKNNKLLTQQEFDEVLKVSYTDNSKKVNYGFGFDVSIKDDKVYSYGHTGSWDGYISLTYHNVEKDRTIIVLNNFDKGVAPYQNIVGILDGVPVENLIPKKIDLTEKEISNFAGVYIDPDDPSSKHMITYLNNHLLYNTDKVDWDMRFFPTSKDTFHAIRQGGTDGVMKFIRQADGTIKLEMKQYGQLIGQGVRQ